MPRTGVYIPFADPDKSALDAEIFWRTADSRRVLSAYVRNRGDPGFGSVISLNDIRCRKTLLKAVDGEQHLLFRDGRRVVQVRCHGEDIRVEPFALELVMDTFPDVESRQRLIRQFADLYRNQLIGERKGGWTVEAMLDRNALATIDLKQPGVIFRDIARFLHGDDLVRDEWTNPNATLKNRTIRSFKRAVRMINGGYRALLL